MEQSPDYTDYIAAWGKRWAERESQWKRWKEQARAEAARLAHILVEEYGASQVYLFGSLALPWVPRHRPDIDLAVRGLSVASHYPAWTRLEEEAEFEVDLVRLEAASPRLLRAVDEEGELLTDAARGPATTDTANDS